MDDVQTDYRPENEGEAGTLSLTALRDPASRVVFIYRRADDDHLVLEGVLDGDRVATSLHRVDPSQMRLHARGFHWIQEYPFNL